MAGNSELIDSIIDPIAVKQVTDLTKYLEDLEAQFVETTKQAIALNNATAKTTTFQKLEQDANKTALSLQKLQTETAKTATAQANLQKVNDQIDAKRTDNANKESTRQAKVQADSDKATKADIANSQKRQVQADKEQATNQKNSRAFIQLQKQRDDALSAARDIGAKYGSDSQVYLTAAENANVLVEKVKSINQPLGDFRDQVGGYANGIKDYFGNAVDRITNLNAIAGRVVTQFGRQIIGLGTGVLSGFIGAKALEELGNLIDKLSIFHPLATEAALAQKNLNDAIAGADYSKAITQVDQLRLNVDLARQGFLDKDKVVDEYNESIGKITGRLDTLNQVEQQLNKNAAIFIKITLLKATAELALADAAKASYKAAQLSANINNDPFGGKTKTGAFDPKATPAAIKQYYADLNEQQRQSRQKDIDNQNQQAQKSVSIARTQYAQIAKIAGQAGIDTPGTNTGVSDAAKTREAIAVQRLEDQKTVAKGTIDNEQATYKARLKALRDYYAAENGIIQLNKNLALSATGLSPNEKQDITGKSNSESLNATLDYNKQRQAILKEQAEDEIKITEQNIQAQKDAAKSVIDSESASLDQRLAAIQKYYDASGKLITLKQKEQIDLAGANKEKQQIAVNDANNDILALTNENQEQLNEAYKKAYDQQEAGAEQHDKNLLGILSQGNADQIAENNKYFDDEAKALLTRYKAGEVDEATYQASIKAIQNTNRVANLQAEINYQQQLIDIKKKANPDADVSGEQNNINKDQLEISKSLEQIETQYAQEGAEARTAIRQQEYQLAGALVQGLQSIVDASYQNQIKNLQDQSATLDTISTQQKQQIESSIASSKTKADEDKVIDAQTLISKTSLSNKQKAIQHQEAVFNREISIANIGINTAESIAKIEAAIAVAEAEATIYLANPLTAALYPGIAALIAAQQVEVGLAAGLGAVQIAAILATPLPSYEKGTKRAKGGLARVSEKGRELVKPVNAQPFLTPDTETIMHIPTGAEIIPNDKLMRMIATPQKLSFVGGQATDMRTVERLLSENIKVTKANKPQRQKANQVYSFKWGVYVDAKRR